MSSLTSRIAARLGFLPAAQARQQVAIAAHRVAHGAAAQRRNLLASLTTSDTSTWQADGLHINAATESGLAVVRARSRDAARNNPWARNFVGMVRRNVLGPQGVAYQSRVRTGAGDLRAGANDALEAWWQAWTAKGVCDVTGRYTWLDIQRLALRHQVVDGECFVRLLPGRGPHGFQVQLLPADVVPLTARADLGGGRIVRQGIELDADGRVLAYHMLRAHAADGLNASLGAAESIGTPRGLLRVPADEVIHLYVPDEANQLRGVPWMQAALKRMWQADDFAASGLNKARESAKRGGWLKAQPNMTEGPAPKLESMTDGTDAVTGEAYQSLHDGTWEKLPYGLEPAPFESDYPNIEYGQFIKDCVRNIASGCEVSYITMGNDLEAVNYSSGQLGLEGERTLWLELQRRTVDHLCAPVHARALKHALLVAPELAGLSFAALPRYIAGAKWQTHRWSPLDPLKHIEAQRSRLEARLSSPQREIAANGDDPDEILADWREWADKTAGMDPDPASDAAEANPATAAAAAAEAASRNRRWSLVMGGAGQ